ncbi:cation-translocating P-type ATPase [Danxiaibacter flavus]|uniref:Cation-translocating P-type ATPase n=1 Tax=Danxiaibacter flavus TaxID=3049108 RepID=A0ABV3ZLK5_9BACT|nr:cation-translocating P-type ATPase [Chitinophagaceae bacterium DXS]
MNIPEGLKGLTTEEVIASRKLNGSNEWKHEKESNWLIALINTLKEPMLLLLIATTIIYFLLHETGEAYFMLAAIIVVSGIEFYQDNRSRKALAALETLNQPQVKVIRNGLIKKIALEELVLNDLMLVEEGGSIPADGEVVFSSDFSVNESILTGEAFAVIKSNNGEESKVFQGTAVVTGMAICRVTAIGRQTELNKLGQSLLGIKEEDTPLQLQIKSFVTRMAIAGVAIFVLVWLVNYLRSKQILDSFLKGLTLAMSILPEEIPVAFTTFMALGAWRLMRRGIIVKQIRTVETLGSATVICTDKTGTITENRMELEAIHVWPQQRTYFKNDWQSEEAKNLITVAMWASEPVPFDPMEKALHKVYESFADIDERKSFQLVHEFPLDGRPPMMTHVFRNAKGKRIIAAKGAPEAILAVSNLMPEEQKSIKKIINELALKGYRILGVALSDYPEDKFPAKQQTLPFHFLGMVAFYDPPKKNISDVFNQFYDAGIKVKIITGDNEFTTTAIAAQAGLRGPENILNGEALLEMDEKKLKEEVKRVNIFTRMFPEAKLRIINALKDQNEIVAMTGDGVNDGPALKAAHIGIAMGKKGTEIAKGAAALVLADDDLSKMIDAIAMGRKIYSNLKRAVQYIISIHIPIILTVSLPLFFGWLYPNIFTPVHVIFLEVIMGPTCSIVYENEPIEKNVMQQPPRSFTTTFLSLKEMGLSLIQGLAITAGVLFVYQLSVNQGHEENETRAMVFTTLLFANIWLTLVNRSFYYSVVSSFANRNALLRIILLITILLTAIILYVPPVANFFHVQQLNIQQLGICLLVAFISVIWVEVWKWRRRVNGKLKGDN